MTVLRPIIQRFKTGCDIEHSSGGVPPFDQSQTAPDGQTANQNRTEWKVSCWRDKHKLEASVKYFIHYCLLRERIASAIKDHIGVF